MSYNSYNSLDFEIINYIENLPKNYAQYYLDSRSVSGFSENILDEIQDLLKQIEFLEKSITEIGIYLSNGSIDSKPKDKLITALTSEKEDLQEIINSNEILINEYRKMLDRESETKDSLCSKLLEKEIEISEYLDENEALKTRISTFEQMNKTQFNHINQLKDSVIQYEYNNKNLKADVSTYSPIIRKINRDVDALNTEKQQIEKDLKIKEDDYFNLEKKYQKVLKDNEIYIEQNKSLEMKILENCQEINLLKIELKNIKNSLRFANNKIKENNQPTIQQTPHLLNYRKRTTTVLVTSKPKDNEIIQPQPYIPNKIVRLNTLLEEIPIFVPQTVLNFNLDKTAKDEALLNENNEEKNYLNGESFDLKKESTEEIKSPKFMKIIENSLNSLKSIKNCEIDAPDSLIKFENNSFTGFLKDFNSKNARKTADNCDKSKVNLKVSFYNRDSDDEQRKKLIAIEQKGNYLSKNREKKFKETNNSCKIPNFLKITLNMFPGGMFFDKIIEISENFIINN